MQVCLGVLGEIEVDDYVDGLDVDSAREQVCMAHIQSAWPPGRENRVFGRLADARQTGSWAPIHIAWL